MNKEVAGCAERRQLVRDGAARFQGTVAELVRDEPSKASRYELGEPVGVRDCVALQVRILPVPLKE